MSSDPLVMRERGGEREKRESRKCPGGGGGGVKVQVLRQVRFSRVGCGFTQTCVSTVKG